jgi:hypothetical protein
VKGAWRERYVTMNKEEANKAFVEELSKQGYTGILIKDTAYDAGGEGKTISQVVIFNPENIQTKSQLTAAYEKAKAELSQPTEGKGPQDFKTAEEYVASKLKEVEELQKVASSFDKKKKLSLSDYAQQKKAQNDYGRAAAELSKKGEAGLISEWEAANKKPPTPPKPTAVSPGEEPESIIQKKKRVQSFIKKQKFQKVDNLRMAMKLPSIKKMSIEQIDTFDKELKKYQYEDVFLTKRQLETVDRTDLAGIKTLREARERLAKEVGVSVEELSKIQVSELDRYRYDVALAERNPFYNLMVEELHKNFIQSDITFLEFENTLNDLTNKARQSRERTLTKKLVPTDELVFKYLSSSDKAKITSEMTSAEIDLALFLQDKFASALEYLIEIEALKTGRENYITNIRRGSLEAFKEDGLVAAIKEMFDQYRQDAEVFNILDQNTGNILPLEKFFQFSMQRKGGIKPTKNVAKAASVYFRTLLKKKALDAFVPKIMIYTDSLTPTKTTPRGLEYDQSLRNFVKEWINSKKGRRPRLFLKQGGKMDLATTGVKAFVSIIDLGLNIPVGIAANVGETVANYAALGKKQTALGLIRLFSTQGKEIAKKYEGFIGRNVWDELREPSKNIGDKFATGMFGLFSSSSVRSNKIGLLGSLTEQEFETGNISPERLKDIRMNLARFRIQPGMKSIIESTTEGGILTQYKTWALPILRTVTSDISKIAKSISKGEPLGAREATELMRAIEITFVALVVMSLVGDDEKDESFSAQLLRKVRRESLTILGALDPEMILGTPRMFTFLKELGTSLKQLITLETYKSSGRKKELKGATGIKRLLTPRALKTFMPEDKKKTYQRRKR